ncbi:MAG: FkbM family methyltransferase [Helicobacter sp.]|nr:FkbM family methyltransferase [Helicobacter sp.]
MPSKLDEIMENYPHIFHMDFMFLDVEGVELEVLKGINFSNTALAALP